jgi:hypothetical protein
MTEGNIGFWDNWLWIKITAGKGQSEWIEICQLMGACSTLLCEWQEEDRT